MQVACDLAVAQNTLRLSAIINLINQLVEPVIVPLVQRNAYPGLTMRPEADCKRYETLYAQQQVTV